MDSNPIYPNPSIPPNNPVIPPAASKTSHLFPILITFIITSILFISGYFGYQKVTDQPTAPTPTPIPTAPPQSIYGQWTTYQNNTCNYAIKIPAYWYAEELHNEDIENNTYLKSDDFNGSLIVPNIKINQGSAIIISCYPSTDSNDQIKNDCIGLNKELNEGICNSTNFGQLKLIYTDKEIYQGIENGIHYSITTPDPSEITQRILSTFIFSKTDDSAIDMQMGFIDSIDKNGDKYSLIIDYANMLSGDEAKQQMIAEEVCDSIDTCDLPNDYYISNLNPKLRTFSISPTVTIDVSTSHQSINLENVMDKQTISFEQFITLINTEEYQVPWWIAITDGVVTHISEQYLP